MGELKQCPFCGGEAKACLKRDSMGKHVRYVRCKGCGIRTIQYEQHWRGAAEAAWNRRVEDGS